MAEQSEITSSDLSPVTDGASACDKLSELAATRSKFATFLDWILSDPTGDLAADFKTAIKNQLLYDAAKKGWFLDTNASTGALELIEKIPLTGLDDGGASDGDLLAWDATAGEWGPIGTNTFTGPPTVGGTTIPAPADGGLLSAPHGLSSTPTEFMCFIECNAVDANYAVGDRLDANSLMQQGSGGEIRKAVTIGVNGSLVFAVFINDGAAARTYRLPDKAATYGEVVIDPTKWDVKFWAKV